MARPKKRSSAEVEEPKQQNSLLNALRFLGAVTKEAGAVYDTHVLLNNGWATAFNGVIAAGHKIEEDIRAAPNNKLLTEALSKCGKNLNFTQLDNGRLSIKSDKFKAIVPCVDPSALTEVFPDQWQSAIDDRFKSAIEAVGVLANENGQRVVEASILLNGHSCIATNGVMLFECWHGNNLPQGLPLPKAIVQSLAKTNKSMLGFGLSNASITFYFADQSWMRTQYFSQQWPDLTRILNTQNNPLPLPEEFFNGLEAVLPFSPDGLIRFGNGAIQSHDVENEGASYNLPGLPSGPVFNAKQLMLIKPYVKKIDFFAEGMTVFYGDMIRGFIAGRR